MATPAHALLTDEEKMVDPNLGYPRGYAKLCRNAHAHMRGLITPYTEGPPQRFLPYAIARHEIEKMKELDELFPPVESQERDPPNARRYADSLWPHLDHLGNAGFDPEKFRIDLYGNVLYKYADASSPLAWEVDHWFPHSRGGITVPTNLRIVQCQVNQRKQNKLEFLVPWWDLQLGIAVNQFLSIFASRNSDFRQKGFSWLFYAGEDKPMHETSLTECHSWPHQFREKRGLVGLAPAAIVRVQKNAGEPFKVPSDKRSMNSSRLAIPSSPARKRWSAEEEEALRRGVLMFGPGNWKEIKEHEPLLQNRSTVQIKDKYRQIKGNWVHDKENKNEQLILQESTLSRSLFKEQRLKKVMEKEIILKQEELLQTDCELKELQEHNEAQLLAIESMECALIKQRRKVEKDRQWSEAQASYKSCLEKMIRDAMHQSVMYKEQGRLNQATCTTLLATLEAHKATRDAAEMNLLKTLKDKEDLKALLHPYLEEVKKKHKSGNCGNNDSLKLIEMVTDNLPDSDLDLPAISPIADVKPLANKLDDDVVKEGTDAEDPKQISSHSDTLRSKLDVVVVGYEYRGDERVRTKTKQAESVGDNLAGCANFRSAEHLQNWGKEDCGSGIRDYNPLGEERHKLSPETANTCLDETIANVAKLDKQLPHVGLMEYSLKDYNESKNADIESIISLTNNLSIDKKELDSGELQDNHQFYVCQNNETTDGMWSHHGCMNIGHERIDGKIVVSSFISHDGVPSNPNSEVPSGCMNIGHERIDRQNVISSFVSHDCVPSNPNSNVPSQDVRKSELQAKQQQPKISIVSKPALMRCESAKAHPTVNSFLGIMKIGEASHRIGEDQSISIIKSGLAASMKACANMWKKAVKKLEGGPDD